MQKLGTPVLLIVAILLVVGFLYTPQGCQQGGGSQSMSAAAATGLTNPVLTVGESHIYAAEVETVVRNMRAQAMADAADRAGAPEMSPYEYLSVYMQAASSLARQAAVIELGRQQRIEVDDEAMRNVVVEMNEATVSQQRQQFEMMQAMQIGPMEAQVEKLKKDKAPADQIASADKALADAKALTFDKMYQQQTGKLPQDYVNEQVETIIKTASQDPVVARSIEATAIQSVLNDRYAQGLDTSDAALKASFDKIVFKQIMLSGENADSRAAEVLKKIRGGLDFDQAAKQFSMLKKPDGSVQLDTTIETRVDMIGSDLRAAILDLKVGDVSEVVSVAGTAYIYKLVAVRPDVPQDFETVKIQRIEMLKQRLVTLKANEAILALVGDSGEKVKWVDEAFQLLTEYMNTAGKPDQVAALESVLKKAGETESTFFPDVAPLVKYSVLSQLQVEVKDPVKRKALDAQMLAAYEDVIPIAPSIDLRFQYINALIPAGKGDRALELLLDNALAASSVSDETKKTIERIEQLLPKVANQATKDNELIAEIQEEIKRWRDDLAERKKEEEAERKRLAEEEAELKKQDAAKPKPSPTTTPAPTPVEPEPIPPKPPGSGG